MDENYYILGPDGELYHYGVKGMKWGVRRDHNLLLKNRRNKAYMKANEDYRSGKITKEERAERVKKAQGDMKKSLEKTKKEFANAKTEAERERIQHRIVEQTTKEVSNVAVKRGARTANAVFAAIGAGQLGMSALSLAAVNPAFGGAALAAGALGIAAELGQRYLIELGLDKVS